MSTENDIRRIIVENLNWDPSQGELTDDYPLIETHVIDSLSMLELISRLEKEFGIKIKSQELGREVFSSVSSLSEFIEART